MSTNYLETISTMVEIGLGWDTAGNIGKGSLCNAL